MLENNWNLIAKHLAKEPNEREEQVLNELKQGNPSAKKTLDDSIEAWNAVTPNSKNYNKKRVQTLMGLKIIFL